MTMMHQTSCELFVKMNINSEINGIVLPSEEKGPNNMLNLCPLDATSERFPVSGEFRPQGTEDVERSENSFSLEAVDWTEHFISSNGVICRSV